MRDYMFSILLKEILNKIDNKINSLCLKEKKAENILRAFTDNSITLHFTCNVISNTSHS